MSGPQAAVAEPAAPAPLDPPGTPVETPGRVLVTRGAWSTGLLLLGSLSLALAWQHWAAIVIFALAAVLPLVVVRLLVRVGLSAWASASIIAMLLVMVAYLLGSWSGTSLGATVVDAVPRLLTSPQPYALHPDLLAAPLLLAGLVSLFVGLRVPAATLVAPVAGASVLYAAGAALTRANGDRFGLLAAALAVLALLGWVLLDPHRESARSRLGIAGPAAVVGVGLLAAAAVLPAVDRFDPRDLVTPPLTRLETASPLPQLRAWGENPDVELLTVRGPEVPLRLVVLDEYDGNHWRAASRFAPFGTATTDLPEGTSRRTVTSTVQLTGLGGYWLPTPGAPTAIDDRDALVDPRTGSLIDPESVASASYTVSGEVPVPDGAALLNASVPTDPAVERYLRLPELPPGLAQYAAEIVAAQNAQTTYERALAIEQAVRTGRTLSTETPSGSALWRIERFLLGPPDKPGAGSGTSEQFATAFAVLARANGLPTRVVVGFKPGSPTADGTRVVRGGDAVAWPEVYLDRLGWIPFNPLPDDSTFIDDRPLLPEGDDPAEAQPLHKESEGPTPRPGKRGQGDREEAPAPTSPWWAALVLVLPAGLVTARGARSLVHRRRGGRGAWSEVVDGLRLAGRRPARTATATDTAEHTDAALGLESAGRIAASAEHEAFGPGGEPAGQTAEVRGELRGDLAAVRRGLRRSLPWWRRWAWWLDPRVFLPRR